MTGEEWQHHVEEVLRPFDTDPAYSIEVSPARPMVGWDDPVVWVGWYGVDPAVGALNGGEYGIAVTFLDIDQEFDPVSLAAEIHTSYADLIEDVTTVRRGAA